MPSRRTHLHVGLLAALLLPGTARAALAYPAFRTLFIGTALSEPTLIEIASAYEHATHRRVPPPLDMSAGCGVAEF